MQGLEVLFGAENVNYMNPNEENTFLDSRKVDSATLSFKDYRTEKRLKLSTETPYQLVLGYTA